MTCAEFEILLCDYVDGTLGSTERVVVQEHLSTCAACSELAADVSSTLQFIERAALAEPPAELLTRILHEIPSARPLRAGSGWRTWFSGWFQSVLQPRYVMGMAMTILSFSMIARFSGIQPRQLHPSDLDPAKIWVSVDDRAHRGWDRAVKYYENLRLVIEVQSRLREWSEQDEAARAAASRSNHATAKSSDRKQK